VRQNDVLPIINVMAWRLPTPELIPAADGLMEIKTNISHLGVAVDLPIIFSNAEEIERRYFHQ
jgi:hypothetical protein